MDYLCHEILKKLKSYPASYFKGNQPINHISNLSFPSTFITDTLGGCETHFKGRDFKILNGTGEILTLSNCFLVICAIDQNGVLEYGRFTKRPYGDFSLLLKTGAVPSCVLEREDFVCNSPYYYFSKFISLRVTPDTLALTEKRLHHVEANNWTKITRVKIFLSKVDINDDS